MYMDRQQEYIQRLNKAVTAKQERLTAELKELEKLGLIG
jgi:DNA-binding HxlR family transcriptional regulator